MSQRNKRRGRSRGTPLSQKYANRGRAQGNRLEIGVDEFHAIVERAGERLLEASERAKLMAFVDRLALIESELASPDLTEERLRELVSDPGASREHLQEEKS